MAEYTRREKEACWNCGELTEFRVVYFECDCGVRWRETSNGVTPEVAEGFRKSREAAIAKNIEMPVVDFTKPKTPNHP